MGNSQCKAVCIQDKSGASFNNVKKKMKKLPSNEVLISKEHMSQLKELPFTNVKDFNKGKNVIVLHNINIHGSILVKTHLIE